jgi:hypothetical protein
VPIRENARSAQSTLRNDQLTINGSYGMSTPIRRQRIGILRYFNR